MSLSDELILGELSAIRNAIHSGHAELGQKLEGAVARLTDVFHEHELEDTRLFAAVDKRLDPLEQVRRTTRWFTGISIVALVGAVVEFFVNHGSKVKP